MGWTQIIFGAVLVLVLLFVATLYCVRQVTALRRLAANEAMASEEWNYQRSQARRRLITSALMFLLGIMLAGALLFLEVPAQQLADQREALEIAQVVAVQGLVLPSAGAPSFPQVAVASRVASLDAPALLPLDADQRVFARYYGGFWFFFLLVLMAIVFLAALDLWATRRWGVREHRKLVSERRAMIEREVARLRQARNGHT